MTKFLERCVSSFEFPFLPVDPMRRNTLLPPPAPLQCDLIRTGCVCNCPVSKEGQSLGPEGQDFGVGISEPRDSACTSVAAVRRAASTGRAVSPFPVRVLSACVIRFPRPSHARPGGQSGLGKRGPASALRGWGGPAAAPLGP